MFCPLKLYLQNNLNESIKNKDFLVNKTLKELRIDLQNLFQRNLKRLKKEMTIDEIENTLKMNIENYMKNSLETIENSIIAEEDSNHSNNAFNDNIEKNEESVKDKIELLKSEIKNETKFNLKILALKSQKTMEIAEKDGNEIAELFFPTTMYSYLIKDDQLELIGSADKIEIIKGRYFPINLKSNKPPLKGVWDNDAVEIVASALLIEQEFETEVFVGFIEYTQIGDRRPVVMDVNLRKSLFKIISEIKEIIETGTLPDVNINPKKCYNCDYMEICDQNTEIN